MGLGAGARLSVESTVNDSNRAHVERGLWDHAATLGIDTEEQIRLAIWLHDANGNLVGGSNGDDLIVAGSIDRDGDGTPDYKGILLRGEVEAFGFRDTGSNVDEFDFLFRFTGGALAPFFDGQVIGITLTSEQSTFSGRFDRNFAGRTKGNIGLIPAVCDCQQDDDPPALECPPDIEVGAGDSIHPDATGYPQADDLCGVELTYEDRCDPESDCEQIRIERTWTARDSCGNSTSCVQLITIVCVP